jgi:hypothetical protein
MRAELLIYAIYALLRLMGHGAQFYRVFFSGIHTTLRFL